MKSKKSNIQIVKDYLAGERPFVQVGYSPPNMKREEGEQWEDNQGIKWKQRKGYKVRVNEQAEIIRNAIKRTCQCGQEITYGGKLDEVFFSKTGKCFDCIIKEETEYRVLGVYPQYEKYKLLSNYLGFLEDMRNKITDSVAYFDAEEKNMDVLCNGEGFIEKFKGLNTGELLKNAKKDLVEIKKALTIVKKDVAKAKKIFTSALKKAKTQWSVKNK